MGASSAFLARVPRGADGKRNWLAWVEGSDRGGVAERRGDGQCCCEAIRVDPEHGIGLAADGAAGQACFAKAGRHGLCAG